MPTRSSPVTLRRLVRARDLLHAEFRRAPRIGDLVDESGLSRALLMRRFEEVFGVPPHRYLTELRMEEAKRALARGESVTEVCFSVGYESLGSFSSSFTRRFGRSPRAFQKQARAVARVCGWQALWIPSCYVLTFSTETFGEVSSGASVLGNPAGETPS